MPTSSSPRRASLYRRASLFAFASSLGLAVLVGAPPARGNDTLARTSSVLMASDAAGDSVGGGCSLDRRNPGRIGRAIMTILTIIGIGSLWRRRRGYRPKR